MDSIGLDPSSQFPTKGWLSCHRDRSQEGELEELEKGVEPSWGKLVEPLERITDRLEVIWGMVDHLKAVKDSADLRAAVEEVQVREWERPQHNIIIRISLHYQLDSYIISSTIHLYVCLMMDFINPVDFSFVSQPDKVKFQLRLGQSKPIYQAFQAIRNSSDWDSLTDARKRVVEGDLLRMTHNPLSCLAMIKHHLFLTSSDPSRLIVFLLSIISSNKGCCSQWSCT